MIVAVSDPHYSGVINLGSLILMALVAISTLSWFFFGLRYRAMLTIERENSATLKEGRDVFQGKYERLEKQLAEEQEIRHGLKAELAAARMATDLTGLMEQLGLQHRETIEQAEHGRSDSVNLIVDRLAEQESRHMSRHGEIIHALAEMTGVLREIRRSLNHENGGSL